LKHVEMHDFVIVEWRVTLSVLIVSHHQLLYSP
jgi:hypothetical protein